MSKPLSELGINAPLQQANRFKNLCCYRNSKQVIPIILNKPEDLVALSKTGTGKTAALDCLCYKWLRWKMKVFKRLY